MAAVEKIIYFEVDSNNSFEDRFSENKVRSLFFSLMWIKLSYHEFCFGF